MLEVLKAAIEDFSVLRWRVMSGMLLPVF